MESPFEPLPRLVKVATVTEKGLKVDVKDLVNSYLKDGYYMLDLGCEIIFSKTPITKEEEAKYRKELDDFIKHGSETITQSINRRIVDRIMAMTPEELEEFVVPKPMQQKDKNKNDKQERVICNMRMAANNPPGKYFLEGIVLPFDKMSQHGYVYSKEGAQDAFIEFKRRLIDNDGIPGVFEQRDHISDIGQTMLENISHKVVFTEITSVGIWAKIEVLNTPKGRLVQQLMDNQVLLFGASRGMGSVEVAPPNRVHLDSIISFDLTCCPSFNNMEIVPLIPHTPVKTGLEDDLIKEYKSKFSNTDLYLSEAK